MKNALLFDYYKAMLCNVRRGNYRGTVSNAKPLFMLTIIDRIAMKKVVDNKIYFDDDLDKHFLYKQIGNGVKYGKTTILSKPFYFLSYDGFYHLQWRGEPIKRDTPSAKFIRDNIEYAYLDTDLWQLLQDEEVRQEYRQAIINRYLKQ